MRSALFPREVARANTTCKRCGAKYLAWVQFKSGKWSLCEVQHDPQTEQEYAVTFHRCIPR